MELLYLSRADIEGLQVTMKEVIDAVDLGLRLKGQGKTQMPPKPNIYPRPGDVMHPMPAYVGDIDVSGVKWISGYPTNPAKGLPYISGLIILNDSATGIPNAVMDGAWITAIRTGASVGVAAKYLASKDSSVAGLLGCGVQARFAIQALVEVLPNLKEVRIFDIFPQASARFAAEMGPLCPSIKITICDTAVDIAENADVVATAIPITPNPDPEPLDAGMLKPGALGIGLDYDVSWTKAAIDQCDKVFSDDIGQLMLGKSHGSHLQKIPDPVTGELGEVVAGVRAGRESANERIFSVQMGIGIEDMTTAKMIYDKALATNAGTLLPL